MANVDASFGLRPIRHRNGAPYNGAANLYYIPASYATALFIGDPVVKTGTSNTSAVDGFPDGTLPAINKATAGTGNAVTGVIVGFMPNRNDLSKQYNPASTERIAMVADDPDLVFEIQADGTIADTDVGLNSVLIYTNAGSTVTGLSGAELNTAVKAAVAAHQLTIQRVVADVKNETASANTVVEVKINNHTEAHGVIGI